MDKLKFKTKDLTNENIEKIGALFPSCITEIKDESGKSVKAIDFDVLKDCLSNAPVAGDDDSRYTMLWPGKRAARQLAYKSTTNTLRPCPEESVDFENTENLYIEGDNLEVLKLLRETYLGKVKMIYIDPPYNTGNDFIYNDDFKQNADEYIESTGQVDEEGNRLVKNSETSGRFHSNWLNMMYPRLLVARDLLADDGVIFISIDNNELTNLRVVCDNVFGENNFISNLIWQKKTGASDAKGIATITEYIVVYAKHAINISESLTINSDSYDLDRYKYQDEYVLQRGPYYIDNLDRGGLQYSDSLNFGITCPDGKIAYPNGRTSYVNDGWIWKWSKQKIEWAEKNNFLEFRKSNTKESGWSVCYKNYLNVDNENKQIVRGAPHKNLILDVLNANAAKTMKEIFGTNSFFNYSKPYELIKKLIGFVNTDKSIILDFFSGSATTAHAVMQLNAKDNGNRKFIMVQLPESCAEDSEAFKAGYKNICEIGKERIRRAGKKILEEHPDAKIDTGFRVLKVDSSNTKDIYYKPNETQQRDIEGYIDNLKEDRSSFDLLFQVMLELGIPLDVSIKTTTVNGLTVYNVAGNSLIACFDKGVNEDLIKEMAKQMPLYAAFRDVAYLDDSTKINVEQIFKQLSRDTKIFAI